MWKNWRRGASQRLNFFPYQYFRNRLVCLGRLFCKPVFVAKTTLVDTIQSVAWRAKYRKACLPITATEFETQSNWAQIQLLTSQCVTELLPQVWGLLWGQYLLSSAGIIIPGSPDSCWSDERKNQVSFLCQDSMRTALPGNVIFDLRCLPLKILSQRHLCSTDLLKT